MEKIKSTRHIIKSCMYVLKRKHYAIKYVPVHDYTIYNKTYTDLIERLTLTNNTTSDQINNMVYSKIIDELETNKNKLEPFVYP